MKTAPTPKHELVIRAVPASKIYFHAYLSSNAAVEWIRKCVGYIEPVTTYPIICPEVPAKLMFSILPNYNPAEVLEFITSKDFCEPYKA